MSCPFLYIGDGRASPAPLPAFSENTDIMLPRDDANSVPEVLAGVTTSVYVLVRNTQATPSPDCAVDLLWSPATTGSIPTLIPQQGFPAYNFPGDTAVFSWTPPTGGIPVGSSFPAKLIARVEMLDAPPAGCTQQTYASPAGIAPEQHPCQGVRAIFLVGV